MSNLDGRRYQDVYVIDMQTGERKLALKKARNPASRRPTGRSSTTTRTGTTSCTTWRRASRRTSRSWCPASFVDTEDDHNVVKPPRPAARLDQDGGAVLLSDGWDIWKVPVAGGAAVNLTVNGKKDGIRYRSILRLDPDEKGIDLSAPRYVSVFGECTKKGGIARLEPGKPGVQMLLWDDAAFGLQKAKNADVYLYAKSTYKDPPDYYVTDASLKTGRKLTDGRRAGEGLHVVERPDARRLHVRARQGQGAAEAAGLAVPARELREGQDVPDDRLHLREADAGTQPVRGADRERLQQVGLHEQRLRRAAARHHLRAERSGRVGGGVHHGGREGRDRDRRRRSEARRPAGPFVGRLPDGVHRDADRHVRGGRRRRAADQHGQHVQPDLQELAAAPTRRSSRAARAGSSAATGTTGRPTSATRR